MVVIKLAILLFFVVVAFTAFNSGNFVPFAPQGTGGVAAAAGVIFFAYIGFDAVSTGSEESKNPGRDLPIAVIGSLLISTVLYVIVAIAAIGVAPIETLTGSDAPLAAGLREGAGIAWAGGVLALGALVAITSVVLVIMYGQTRIFFAMCRDGLFPRRLAHVHPRFGTPARLTIGFGILISLLAAFVPFGGHRRARQHRNALRLRSGQYRRHRAPSYAAGDETTLQGAVLPGVSVDRHRLLHLPDDSATGHHLDPIPDLADRRTDHLLRLFAPALPGQARSCAE
jgi:amino acid transporter